MVQLLVLKNGDAFPRVKRSPIIPSRYWRRKMAPARTSRLTAEMRTQRMGVVVGERKRTLPSAAPLLPAPNRHTHPPYLSLLLRLSQRARKGR